MHKLALRKNPVGKVGFVHINSFEATYPSVKNNLFILNSDRNTAIFATSFCNSGPSNALGSASSIVARASSKNLGVISSTSRIFMLLKDY